MEFARPLKGYSCMESMSTEIWSLAVLESNGSISQLPKSPICSSSWWNSRRLSRWPTLRTVIFSWAQVEYKYRSIARPTWLVASSKTAMSMTTTLNKWLPMTKIKHDSLANAKVSAWQPWYIGRSSLNRNPLRIAQQYQHNLYIVEKYFQCATIPSLTMRVYLHSFSRYCPPNMPASAKFRENLNLQQFKVIQGRWFWCQSKAHI